MTLTDRDRRLGGKLRCPFCYGREVSAVKRVRP